MACLRRAGILSARALWISQTVDREYVAGLHVAVKLPSPRRTCLAASARKTLSERSVQTMDPADRSHCTNQGCGNSLSQQTHSSC